MLASEVWEEISTLYTHNYDDNEGVIRELLEAQDYPTLLQVLERCTENYVLEWDTLYAIGCLVDDATYEARVELLLEYLNRRPGHANYGSIMGLLEMQEKRSISHFRIALDQNMDGRMMSELLTFAIQRLEGIL